MNKTQFMVYITQQVNALKLQWAISMGQAFGVWFATEYLELDDTDAYECVAFDGGNDKDIDLFYVNHEGERIVIAQLKYNAKGTYKANKNELLGLFHTTDWLRDPEALARDGRKDLEAAAKEYLEATSNGFSVEYIYAYCGPDHKDVLDTARQFNVGAVDSATPQSCKVMALESLQQLHEERIGTATRLETVELELPNNGWFIEKDGFGRALITSLSGDQLRELHAEFGDQLFERNVRLFLGARKGSVNAGLRDTLDSASDRRNFWAYNNGVTFICDNFDLDGNKITLHNFSVVNGCQSTVSLSNATAGAAKKVKVLTRFIAADEKVIDSIIRFTNSQTPIRIWDFMAQDKVQKKLKKELSELSHPFLYVIRPGELNQLTTAEKKQYKRNNKLQTIKHDLNAQFQAAFIGLPSVSYKDKGKIFSAYRDQVFPSQIRPEEIILVWQAGNVAKAIVKEQLEEAIRDEDNARVSILKRGAHFFILAIMGFLLHQRNGKTFLNKISAEKAASNKTIGRLKNYAVVALEWYVEVMTDQIDTGKEVSSLVRSQENWLKLMPRFNSKWKMFRVATDYMENALPKL